MNGQAQARERHKVLASVLAMLKQARVGSWRTPEGLMGGLRSVGASVLDGKMQIVTKDSNGARIPVLDAARQDPAAWDWVRHTGLAFFDTEELRAACEEMSRGVWPRPRGRRGATSKHDKHLAVCVAIQALKDAGYSTAEAQGEVADGICLSIEQVSDIWKKRNAVAAQCPDWPLLVSSVKGDK